MFKQFRDVLKTIGRKNQISAIYIIIVSLIIISLELISFALIIPAVSIPLKSDLLLNSSIFNFLNEITSFDLISFLTLKNVLMLLISIILLKLIFIVFSIQVKTNHVAGKS